jgi:hypothetical protein
VKLLILPILTQQAQDVQRASDNLLLFSIVARQLRQTSRSLENRGFCLLDPLQQFTSVRLEDGGAVKLSPILTF